MSKVSVLGAGTWGIALARHLAISGHEVVVWSALPEEVDQLSKTRRQPNLPGMIIPDSISFTKDVSQACQDRDLIVFAVPSVFVRSTALSAAPHIPDGQVIVDVAKGIEEGTMLSLTRVIREELDRCGGHEHVRLVALSGPTHAEEVACDLPTAIVAACEDLSCAQLVQDIFMSPSLRVYTNPDVRGVELCGAMKNAVALACGISAGLGFGDNARAALITRGMEEIKRLGLALGCKERTFYGLAGIGDLVVTATSEHSRNFRAGRLMGQGATADEARRLVGQVVEGINVLPAAMELSARFGVEMPIVSAVNDVVRGTLDPREAVGGLMGRQRKSEVSEEGGTHPSEGQFLGLE